MSTATPEQPVESAGAKSGEPSNRGAPHSPNLKFLIGLTVLAFATRLAWVLWVHPPSNYVYSDMGGYVTRATDLVRKGFVPGTRHLAWQAWGTHHILAACLKLFGLKNLTAGGILWGLMGAASVPASYLLACRVMPLRWMATAVGLLAFLWHPNLVTTGFFTSETPFLCFALWSTYYLVKTMQEGRGAVAAGVLGAISFAIRPQSALFFTLLFLFWLLIRKRPENRAKVRHIVGISLPLVAMLIFSMWRFHAHTGYWGGIAEAANANLTAGRCHNPRTQAFKKKLHLDRSRTIGDGRRIGIIPLSRMLKSIPHDSVLGLRPAFGRKSHGFKVEVNRPDGTSEMVPVRIPRDGWSIKFVGYIGDPDIHKSLRALCYRKTGVLEQIRYSVLNLSGLWFFNYQWPDTARDGKIFAPYSKAYLWIFDILFLLPSFVGIAAALRRPKRYSGLTIVSLHLIGLYVVSAVFFGSVRLRTPYDVFAIILAVYGYWVLAQAARNHWPRLLAKVRGQQPAA